MTKKDYIIIAEVLRHCINVSAWCFDNTDDQDHIIDEFAKAMKRDNPRFNYKRFKDYIIK